MHVLVKFAKNWKDSKLQNVKIRWEIKEKVSCGKQTAHQNPLTPKSCHKNLLLTSSGPELMMSGDKINDCKVLRHIYNNVFAPSQSVSNCLRLYEWYDIPAPVSSYMFVLKSLKK